jgi:hypothetical protein
LVVFNEKALTSAFFNGPGGWMERPVFGLKTEADNDLGFEDCFFSNPSDGGEPIQLEVAHTQSSRMSPLVSETKKFSSFNEITAHIQPFLVQLREASFSGPAPVAEVSLIPEHIVPEELAGLLVAYAKDPQNLDLLGQITGWEATEFPATIVAQLDLLKFSQDPTVDLEPYAAKKIDSRIKALIHFALARRPDRAVSLWHVMRALEEFVKFPAIAPIAVFFPGFSLREMVFELCRGLADLFPRNPLLLSVIDNLAVYNPDVTSCIPSECDDSDSSSHSFFRSISRTESKAALISGLFQNSVINPLDSAITAANVTPVTFSEPPTTVTYQTETRSPTDKAKSEVVSPAQFQAWITSIGLDRSEVVRTRSHSVRKPLPDAQAQVLSDPQFRDTTGAESIGPDDTAYLFNLIRLIDPGQAISLRLPASVSPLTYGLYLPVLHAVNISSRAAEHRGALYIRLLTMEREAHIAVKTGDYARGDRSLAYFQSQIPAASVDGVVVKALDPKRPHPSIVGPMPDCFVAVQALVDYELVVHGRSPLSLGACQTSIQSDCADHPVRDRVWRAKMLFKDYVANEFSPYIAFRICFALATNLAELQPSLACSFLFEGLYVMLCGLSMARNIPCIRSAMLLFGQLLERLGKYYYCATVLDNFFLVDGSSEIDSSTIAQMALNNRDLVRGVFYYHQSLKYFVSKCAVEEGLYIAQALAGIYLEHWHLLPAMSVLSYVLCSAYPIPFNQRRDNLDIRSRGSLKIVALARKTVDFKPDPSSVSAVLTCCYLVTVFVKLHMFPVANSLLQTLGDLTKGMKMTRLVLYLRMWTWHRQNDLSSILDRVPMLEPKAVHGTFASHFKVHNRASFDPSVATMRLLARIFIDLGNYQLGLFWAEMFLSACSAARPNEIANAFTLRGNALLLALEHIPHFVDYKLPKGSRWALSKNPTREALLTQAVSSFYVASVCYSKVGRSHRDCYCRLILAELLQKVPKELQIVPPVMFIAHSGHIDWRVEYNIVDVGGTINDLGKLTDRLLNPLFIIHHQLLSARLQATRGQTAESTANFDFALSNFTTYFVCGHRFLPTDLSVQQLSYVFRILQLMCELLLEFPPDFVNDRLVIFDVMNHVHALLANWMKDSRPSKTRLIIPSLSLHRSVVEFENVRIPPFGQSLLENGFINETLDESVLTTADYLAMIACNTKLFDANRMSPEEMNGANRRLCKLIAASAEHTRRENLSQIPADTSFSYLMHSCPSSVSIVFVQRLGHRIAVYRPFAGGCDYIAMDSLANSQIVVTNKSIQYHFTTRSSLFSDSFIEQIANLINFDRKATRSVTNRCKVAEMSASSFFGTVFDDVPPSPTKPCPALGRHIEVGFSVVKVDKPIVICASVDLNSIPFEWFFPRKTVVRIPFYSSLLLRVPRHGRVTMPRAVVLRNVGETFKAASLRAIDVVGEMMCTIGGGDRQTPTNQCDRTLPLTSQLFKSGKDTGVYQKKWQFAEICHECPAQPGFFVFTYADLAESNIGLIDLFSRFPFAFFMFVPGSCVKEAFHIIGNVYRCRHKKSPASVRKGAANEALPFDSDLDFIVSLQGTLQRILKAAVPVFAHL